jgi:glucosamine--fructose-6-phosphate aminotransferase (isomerizing)
MCGIVGTIGKTDTLPFLLEGLGRLEYRGYDSAGVAVLSGNEIQTRKAVGGVSQLVDEVARNPVQGNPGISHTRWATHGSVTTENAHPHLDASGRLALVHNGVVENHKHLRDELIGRGHVFRSQTDTEVLAHLIGEAFDQNADRNRSALLHAMQEALRHVRGTYAIAVIHADLGRFLAAARSGSPLVLGIGKDAQFIASDAAALDGWVQDIIYLKDQDIAALDGESFHLATVSGGTAAAPKLRKIEVEARATGRGLFPHQHPVRLGFVGHHHVILPVQPDKSGQNKILGEIGRLLRAGGQGKRRFFSQSRKTRILEDGRQAGGSLGHGR